MYYITTKNVSNQTIKIITYTNVISISKIHYLINSIIIVQN
jgi:hypothetical protein